MTKLYFEAITVVCRDDQPPHPVPADLAVAMPVAFTWRRRVHHITAVLRYWVVQVDWWRSASGIPREGAWMSLGPPAQTALERREGESPLGVTPTATSTAISQEVSRRYYKVECEDLGVYEIYRERDQWFLERLYD